jgi:hypothetical protein
MKKVVTLVIFTITCLVLTACTSGTSPESSPVPEVSPTEAPAPDPNYEQDEAASVLSEEDVATFILLAEQVYRDIILGGLFEGRWDEELEEWIWSEYLEEAQDLQIDGFNMLRWRVLPSSGFTSVLELNNAVHEYWSDDFEVSETPRTESIDYMELDGALYFLPAMASGIGDSFFGILWELAEFEILSQEDNNITAYANVYLTSYGDLFRGTVQWEIKNDRITTRSFDWGEFVLWRDVPEAINAMVTSGRFTEEYVASGWIEQQEAR